ncbi:hypothetical protein [Schinkia azotoformans]|uniref:hypothetical protein n=1 Tax=Schinkia azotoformans TaxID=1454 RepID=UPI002DB6B345|nr:hypothetical protein [Schinkia azotoformans]MEC1714810.1 hypothetical protein [Schinkia azotoformans]MEC1741716.1 hypothetical protein [Schinkia azotoformans]MEC1766606.1 hypothetical protein [Schinkia azotoformans]MEC1788021.1 hypothetical protein [Schinkia azotoformans]MED4375413.1 hypothetical protein [Schinkia azotoformans]
MITATVVGERPQSIYATADFFSELVIPKPDFNLRVESGSHENQLRERLIGIQDNQKEKMSNSNINRDGNALEKILSHLVGEKK